MNLRPLFVLALASVTVVTAACTVTSNDTGGGAPTDDGGGATDAAQDTAIATDAATDAVTADGSTDAGAGDLFPADTTKIVFTDKGGLPGPPGDGTSCSIADATYTLLLPTRELSWKVCESINSDPPAFKAGSVTLSAADFVPLSNALHGLRRTLTPSGCGADKPFETLVFTTPAGDAAYYDDFYFCDAKDTKKYVSNIGTVYGELKKVAK